MQGEHGQAQRMPSNLPESEIPDVREYIFVDTNRVRSLLAQMGDGLPDEKARCRPWNPRTRSNFDHMSEHAR